MDSAKESIFKTSIRAFLKAFFSIMGILIGIVVLGIAISSLFGSMNMPAQSKIKISPDSNGKAQILPDTTPVILRINIHGVIGTRDLTAENIETLLLDSRSGLIKKNRIKGLLLHMNTPGGLATANDTIYRHIMTYKEKYKIPVYAYIDGICASGGMYIAAASDKIYSAPSGIIGSIGVKLGPIFNFSEVMKKIGIKSLTLSQGIDKDMLSPFRPWKSGEDDSLKNIMTYEYNRFVDIITSNRPKVSKEKLVSIYGAQIFSPPAAEDIGFIDDGNSSYNQALTALTKTAGISSEEKYQVIELQINKPLFADLIEGNSSLLSGRITHTLEMQQTLDPNLMNKVLFLYEP
ncbi:MAG: S49 family peptidase [Simkaniaceae bacterium]|nr:S49 family peptidase [Simkaniaceae bacterium]